MLREPEGWWQRRPHRTSQAKIHTFAGKMVLSESNCCQTPMTDDHSIQTLVSAEKLVSFISDGAADSLPNARDKDSAAYRDSKGRNFMLGDS